MANFFLGDTAVKAFLQFEPPKPSYDEISGSSWTQLTGFTYWTLSTRVMQGNAAMYCGTTGGVIIDDASLAAGFPTKLNDSTGIWSLSVRFMCETLPGASTYRAIASKWRWGTSALAWTVHVTASALIFGIGYNNQNSTRFTVSTLTTGVKYHFAAAVDGISGKTVRYRLYREDTSAVVKSTVALSSAQNMSSAGLFIGCESNTTSAGTNFFSGWIDEVVIFAKYLTTEEMAAIATHSYSSASAQFIHSAIIQYEWVETTGVPFTPSGGGLFFALG